MSAPARFDRAVQHSNAKVALLGQGVIVLLEVAGVVHHLPVIFSAEILQGWDCWLARSQSVYRIEFLLCYYFICIVFVRFSYDVRSVFSLQDLLSELTTTFWDMGLLSRVIQVKLVVMMKVAFPNRDRTVLSWT